MKSSFYVLVDAPGHGENNPVRTRLVTGVLLSSPECPDRVGLNFPASLL